MSAATAHEHAEAHGHDHHEHHDPSGRSISSRRTTRSSDSSTGSPRSCSRLRILPHDGDALEHRVSGPRRPVLADWPWFQAWLDDSGKVTGDLYNMFGAMHGTIMVFLGIVPLAFGAFGNYVTPLQIGAPDMPSRASTWRATGSTFSAGPSCSSASSSLGAAKAGGPTTLPRHHDRPPLRGSLLDRPDPVARRHGLLISSSLLGAVNFICTIINLRCKGMTWMRLPSSSGRCS